MTIPLVLKAVLDHLRGVNVDAELLFDNAIANDISIAPGHIFSPRPRYSNFIRLSFGHPWTPRIDDALQWLGDEVHRLS